MNFDSGGVVFVKIIKKILAMILAMNLMIGILPINILEISASSEEQNEEYVETEEQTPSETEEGFDDFTSDGKSETEDDLGLLLLTMLIFLVRAVLKIQIVFQDKILMKMASFLKKMEAQK